MPVNKRRYSILLLLFDFCYRFRLRVYEGVFNGPAFIDWLLEAGLVSDRVEAVSYGNSLLQGCVIEHCLQEHYFHDLPYFYQFTKRVLEESLQEREEEEEEYDKEGDNCRPEDC